MNRSDYQLNKYLPAAALYFFLNGLLLPVGLLYTTILTPLLLVWVARYRYLRYFLAFCLVAAIFVTAHWREGVESPGFYASSFLLSFSVLVFCIAFHRYLSACGSLRVIYRQLLVLNAAMVAIALLFLPFPALKGVFWNSNTLSLSNHDIDRLKLLTYEPSYYSLLFAPVAIYYLLKAFRRELPQPAIVLVLVLVPLFLSLSFGVIGGIALAFVVLLLVHSRSLIGRYLPYVAGGALVLVAAIVCVWLFYPDNIFFRRLENIIAGRDTSFNGRTFDSYSLAMQIAGKKSLVWGAGPGQVKLIAPEIFGRFYHDNRYTIHDVAIPNSMCDLLATLGLAGVAIKLFLEIYFFFKTRVYGNYYRLAVFLFIFLYQFTGSFIMNIAEYVLWIMAFKPGLFPEFDKPES